MADMITLKPCPFCGGSASVHRSPNHGTFIEVAHVNGCAIEVNEQPDFYFDDFEKAITAWNTRI